MNPREADPATSTTLTKRDETDTHLEHSSSGQVNGAKSIVGSAATAEPSTNTSSERKPTAHGNSWTFLVQAIELTIVQVTGKRRSHLEKSHLSQTRNQSLPKTQVANAYVEDACVKSKP